MLADKNLLDYLAVISLSPWQLKSQSHQIEIEGFHYRILACEFFDHPVLGFQVINQKLRNVDCVGVKLSFLFRVELETLQGLKCFERRFVRTLLSHRIYSSKIIIPYSNFLIPNTTKKTKISIFFSFVLNFYYQKLSIKNKQAR